MWKRKQKDNKAWRAVRKALKLCPISSCIDELIAVVVTCKRPTQNSIMKVRDGIELPSKTEELLLNVINREGGVNFL